MATAQFGFEVATAGDVNGDGYADVIVGAPKYGNGQFWEGAVYLFLGSSSGLATTAAWSIEGNQNAAGLGTRVATAGDVNGDGFDDVLVDAPSYSVTPSGREGKQFLYLGSATGLETNAAWSFEGSTTGGPTSTGNPIRSLAAAGDVNGDGFDDVISGQRRHDNHRGRALVFLGSASGLAATPAWVKQGNQAGDSFGAVATAGDVNGDGYSDVIVGAPNYTNGHTDEGQTSLFLGSSSGLAMNPAWVAEGNQAGALMGTTLDTAGDVNGDGYDDVIVSAPLHSNVETNEGRVSVYFGSPSGLSSAPDWTEEFDIETLLFGFALGPAGDFNGDGYDDIVLGAKYYADGYNTGPPDRVHRGVAWLYLGSASGPRAGYSWKEEGEQGFDIFGTQVATAGDVNGNGRDELIVGAPGVSFETGSAHLFSGSCAFDSDTDDQCDLLDNCPASANPAQEDIDVDGVGDVCDCAVADSNLWLAPGGVQGLTLSHDAGSGLSTLDWSPPLDPGGTGALVYDVIRSGDPADFGAGAICIESDIDPGLQPPVDGDNPPRGAFFSYLVRAENACPLGLGSVGTDSNNVPRTARSCP